MGLYSDVDKKSVLTSVINTQLRDGIRVGYTKSIEDTCEFLLQVIQRIAKDPSIYLNVDALEGGATKEDYISKPKVGTAQDLFFFQMTQVPGISAKTAMAFVKEFENMKSFYQQMSQMEDSEKLARLKSIVLEDNGKKRRINSKVAECVLQYMF
jgi:ERCC4-type nuclease